MLQASRRRRKESRTDRWLPFWLIAPTILVLLIVQVYPAFYTAWLSLHEREPQGWVPVGLQNYQRIMATSLFREAVGHTVVFLIGYVVLTLVLGFVVAQILNRRLLLSGFYLTLLFIPWILADILVGIVFRLLVVPDYGVLSGVLGDPNLFPPKGLSILTATRPSPWIGEFPFPPSPAMIYLILAAAWRALPFITLLLLASLQTIPSEVIESARIDGANGWKVARHITIPLILPTLVVALFSLVLGGMNGVGMVFSLTGGGPGTTTHVLSYHLYTLGWTRLRFGQAAALALMIAVVNWLLIGGTMRLTRVDERTA
ncbi:MAG TPA: sugar ABC transporter permease [Anaerolineae bacterium]|nr:sugar ABC transporter permease [Anaerolineae bacterium]